MNILRIDHVQLAMPAGAEDEARGFYSGLLGIPEKTKPENLAGNGGVWFERGDLKVHLGAENDFRPARKAHPALLVEGLDGLLDRMRGAKVEIVPADPITGYERVFVHDPFGNRIELLERVS